MQLNDGTLLQGGKYKIERVLGQGGFGITYLASQVQLGRKVCIKEFFFKQFCERDAATSHVTLGTKSNRELVDKFMQKFVKEARTISQLNHNNIIRIYDIFEENGTAYYVMEYHCGGSLGDLVKDGKPLPEADAVRYITQIADAVGYIHEQRINHLDIKPGNILLDRKGCGVLIDFGLSKQYDEQGSQTSSTPVGISHGYAPMEQYNPGGVSTFTPQSDIYSLGATLYKLVTGVTPPKAMDIFNEGLPALPGYLSNGVRKAIEQSMQLHKSDRPATAEEFVALLFGGSTAAAASAADEPTKIIAQLVEPIENPAPEPVKPVVTEKKEPEASKKPNEKKEAQEPVIKTKKKRTLLKWVGGILAVICLCFLRVGIAYLHYDEIGFFAEGRATAYSNGKFGYINMLYNEVVPLKYDDARYFSEGLACVELNDKFGYIDKNGNEVIPLKYDNAWWFSEGRAKVRLNDKWGYIDKSGNEVIPLKYDVAGSFYEGRAEVELNGERFYIDKQGNRVK